MLVYRAMFYRRHQLLFRIGLLACAILLDIQVLTVLSKPDYVVDHNIGIGSLVLCMVTAICGILYCRWENGKRERGERDDRLGKGSEALLRNRHPHFRSVHCKSHGLNIFFR